MIVIVISTVNVAVATSLSQASHGPFPFPLLEGILQPGKGQGPFKKLALRLQCCIKEMSEAESAPECNASCQSGVRPQTCKAH